jgi:hypothetical protein
MPEDLISVGEVANQLNRHKKHIYKVIERLNIRVEKRKSSANRGALTGYITRDDFHRVAQDLRPRIRSNDVDQNTTNIALWEEGVLYLLLLEPGHDPGRFKVGFAQSLDERLRQLRCSAPYVQVIKTWYCKRLWEKTAIDCVSDGCEQVHTEVFRTDSIASVLAKCDKFFELMPKAPTKI